MARGASGCKRRRQIMNEVLENILTRRSIRSFQEKPVPRQDLETIVKAGMYAPSGMNRQSWQFTAIRNPELINELAQAIREQIGKGPEYNFYGAKALVLVSNDRENTNGLADSACALENMFLMAHALGIGSVWINQMKTICDAAGVRQVMQKLEIPDSHIVWGIAALGYGTDTPAQPEKKAAVKYFD